MSIHVHSLGPFVAGSWRIFGVDLRGIGTAAGA